MERRPHLNPQPPSNEQLILTLLRSDIIITRLLTYLKDTGLDLTNRMPSLRDTILELMDLTKAPDIHQWYQHFMDMKRQARRIPLYASGKPVNYLANRMYKELTLLKEYLQMDKRVAS